MPSILSGQLDQLSQLRIAVYTDVASLALLTYDWLLTFSDEVNMIWMSQAKLSKLLYIRYVGIVSQTLFATCESTSWAGCPNTFTSRCKTATNITIALPTIMWWSVEFVFALRVWILYRRSRKLLMFLTVMYTMSVLQADIVPQAKRACSGLPVTGCFSTGAIHVCRKTSVLCILTIYRILRERNEMTASPLLSLFLVFMCNLFMLRFENAAFKILFNGLLNAVPCMLGARVLINILSLVRTNFGTDATTGPPLSEPKFARNGPRTFDSDEYTFDDGAAKATREDHSRNLGN
ncbi:hypothetical protein L227DRAFT_585905 [Lentinus tigrinus ALCF2SS1-6]|uniref:DUF6533 domain-containing protein n=1 Tax=Lentinus tigrinus ALCF2SS1-6 TaxID=1328759 RepID=A0A5C2SBU6_9APHY|nr:hypothetical protein L227DRAFT_585905 [Lentinus tigrinus ALCF2SS1-6]